MAEQLDGIFQWLSKQGDDVSRADIENKLKELQTDTAAQDTKPQRDTELRKETSMAYRDAPRISTFSGDPHSKADTTFDLWHYEVRCLDREKLYPDGMLLFAVRKSLRGEAGRIVMRLGEEATLTQILDKLSSTYGIVDAGETILSQFYAASQEPGEEVTHWGCRLEDMIDKAKQVGAIHAKDEDDMLRTRFWMGLQKDLKQVSRHKFDTVKSFDRLRVDIRMIEQELKLAEQAAGPEKKLDASVKMASAPKQKDEMAELKGLVHKLANKVDTIDSNFQKLTVAPPGVQGYQYVEQHPMRPQSQTRPNFNQMPSMPQQPGRRYPDQDQPGTRAQGRGYTTQQDLRPSQGQRGGQGTSCWQCGQTDHVRRNCPYYVCWGCGQSGHTKRTCPQALNLQMPL